MSEVERVAAERECADQHGGAVSHTLPSLIVPLSSTVGVNCNGCTYFMALHAEGKSACSLWHEEHPSKELDAWLCPRLTKCLESQDLSRLVRNEKSDEDQ